MEFGFQINSFQNSYNSWIDFIYSLINISLFCVSNLDSPTRIHRLPPNLTKFKRIPDRFNMVLRIMDLGLFSILKAKFYIFRPFGFGLYDVGLSTWMKPLSNECLTSRFWQFCITTNNKQP